MMDGAGLEICVEDYLISHLLCDTVCISQRTFIEGLELPTSACLSLLSVSTRSRDPCSIRSLAPVSGISLDTGGCVAPNRGLIVSGDGDISDEIFSGAELDEGVASVGPGGAPKSGLSPSFLLLDSFGSGISRCILQLTGGKLA